MEHSVKEIGKLAGVSPATVSRVINGSGAVTAEKRKRVLAALEQLNGGRPAPRPRARTTGIGVLLPPEPAHDATDSSETVRSRRRDAAPLESDAAAAGHAAAGA